MIDFRCPNCSKKVSVADEHAGKRGKCPQCKQVMVIPSSAEDEPNPLLDVLAEQQHGTEHLGVERMVREASAPEVRTGGSAGRMILKITVILAFVSIAGLGLWAWNNYSDLFLDSDSLLRQQFETAATDQLPNILNQSDDAWDIFDRMRAGESVEQAMKNASDQGTDLDYSDHDVVRVEVERLADSEVYDAVGTAFWEQAGSADGSKGSFKLGRLKEDQSWVQYEEPPDPALVTFIDQAQPLIRSARRLKSLREVGGNYREYREVVVALRTELQGAPNSVNSDSSRFLKAIDTASNEYAQAVDYWLKNIKGPLRLWEEDQERSFSAGDQALNSALSLFESLEREAE